MPVYQEMDQGVLAAILEKYQGEDILSGEARKEDAYLRQFACIRCGGNTTKAFPGIRQVYSGGLMPKMNLKCTACGCEFDPRTGVLLNLGNVGEAIEQAQAQQTPWVKSGGG
jgi:hypothetical protein